MMGESLRERVREREREGKIQEREGKRYKHKAHVDGRDCPILKNLSCVFCLV